MTFPVIRVPIWSPEGWGTLGGSYSLPTLGSAVREWYRPCSEARHANDAVTPIVRDPRARLAPRLVCRRHLWTGGVDRLARESAGRDDRVPESGDRQKRCADHAHLILAPDAHRALLPAGHPRAAGEGA